MFLSLPYHSFWVALEYVSEFFTYTFQLVKEDLLQTPAGLILFVFIAILLLDVFLFYIVRVFVRD